MSALSGGTGSMEALHVAPYRSGVSITRVSSGDYSEEQAGTPTPVRGTKRSSGRKDWSIHSGTIEC